MKKITYLQLRAARQFLGIGVRELALILKVSKTTISRAETNSTRDFFYKYNAALLGFFQKNLITFPTEFSIRYHPPGNFNINDKLPDIVLSKFQIKTARFILNISQRELCQITGIKRNLLSKLEVTNSETINFLNKNDILTLKNFFMKQKIEFPDPLSIFFKNYVDRGIII